MEQIPPPQLRDREAELAQLAEFCVQENCGAYAWWQAGPWAGKSALMSSFVLNPPTQLVERVWLVSFFITARLAAQDTRDAFTTVMTEQLCALLGQSLPVGVTEATREAVLRDLFAQAAMACQQQGGRLILVVDGLDEDRGVTTGPDARSIAGLLPGRPPAGMRIIVAGRLNPPVPDDVPDWHPLRDPSIVRLLAASPHAHSVQRLGQAELTRLLDGSPLEKNLLGLLTAARGGLSAADLRELTGADLVTIERVLHTVAGRTFTRRVSSWSPDIGPPVYLLGHDELHAIACHYLGDARLAGCRDQLHAWADTYRIPSTGTPWPEHTPEYLLTGYARMLETIGSTDRLTILATDIVRHDRMLDLSGGDAAAFAEIRACQKLHMTHFAPDFRALVRLSYHCGQLESRNTDIPPELPAAWAALGHTIRAESLAHGIASPYAQAEALSALVQVVARDGNLDRAEQMVRKATTPLGQALAFGGLVSAVARAGDVDRARRLAIDAEEIVRNVTEPLGQGMALSSLALGVVEAGYFDHADGIAQSIVIPHLRAQALSGLVSVMARAGDVDRARRLAIDVEQIARDTNGTSVQVQSLTALAEVEVWAGDLDRAEQIARDIKIAEPNVQVPVLIAVVLVMVEAGDPHRAWQLAADAEEIARDATDMSVHVQALTALAQLEAQAGNLDRTRQLATEAELIGHTVDEPFGRAPTLVSLVRMMADVGELDRADQIAHGIMTTYGQAQALSVLAPIVAEASGNLDRSQRLAAEAEQIARNINNPYEQAQALSTLVHVVGQSGDVRRAEQIATKILVPNVREHALSSLSQVILENGELDQAHRIACNITEPSIQARALTALARAWAERGDLERLRQISTEVEQIARNVSQSSTRVDVLVALARVEIERGNLDRARQLASEAEQITRSITEPFVQGMALVDLASVLAQVGDLDRAEHIALAITDQFFQVPALARVASRAGDLARVQRIVSLITDPSVRAQVLNGVVSAMVNAGDMEHARQLATDAEKIARNVTDPNVHAQALIALARLEARVGNMDRVQQLALEAEQIADEIVFPYERADTMIALAKLLAQAGDLSHAEQIARNITDPQDRTRAFVGVAALVDRPIANRLLGEAFVFSTWSAPLGVLGRLYPQLFSVIVDDVMDMTSGYGDSDTQTRSK